MDKPFVKNKFTVAAIIFIFSVLIYLPSVNNDFVWDDVIQIKKEYYKFQNRSFFKSLIPKASKNKLKSYYRPISQLSIYYDYKIWGDNPLGFHLTNIIINAVCSVIVFFLFLLILKKFGIRARENIALFSALLFTVHPMHVESVSWIAGRTDILSTMFFLAAFLAHIRSEKKSYYVILACVFFYLALVSKEVAVAFPFSVLVYEYISNKRFKNGSLLRLAVYFGILILYLVLRYRFGGVIVPEVNNDFVAGAGTGTGAGSLAVQDAGLMKYLAVIKTMFLSYIFYFYKLIVPFWFSSFISEYPKSAFMLILSILSFIALFYVFIISYIRKSGFKAFCILWLLLVLGPSVIISFSKVATTPVAERYLYLPIAPFSLLVIFLFYKLKEYKKMEQPVLIAIAVIILLFSFLTVYRQAVWQDRISFWTDASKNTKDAVPHINLGMAYIDNNNLDEGIQILESSLNSDLKTTSLMKSVSLNNLGIAYLKKGETDNARQVFLDAVEENPRFYKSYYHLGIIYLSYGIKNNAERELGIAKDYFLEAIKYNKKYARAYLGLAKIYYQYRELGKAKQLAGIALKYGLIAPMDQQAKFILSQ